MKKLLLVLFSLILSSPAFAIGQDELLPPEQAFSVNGKAIDANTVEIEWRVAEGYYLYHDKLSFKSDTPGITLGEIVIPAGKKKFDTTFNKELETHRHKLTVRVPLIRTDTSLQNVRLTVGSQGCADIGVCYPPQKQVVLLNLPTSGKAKVGGLQSLTDLGNNLGLGSNQVEFLPPDQAFSFSASIGENGAIVAKWDIAKGYYLYRDKFGFSSDTGGVIIGVPELPEGTMHTGIRPDGSEGEVEVYLDTLLINVPLQRRTGDVTEVSFTAKFQGCADAGICYPPMKKTVILPLPTNTAGPGNLVNNTATTGTPLTDAPTESSSQSAILIILGAFGIGLLLTFTPCVLPMIPILSSIIVGQSEDGKITKLKGGILSSSYVLGTSVTYTAAGVMAGYSGKQLQAYFQNVWAVSIISGILVLLALSMLGLFTLQMPSSIQSRLQESSSKTKSGSLIGVFMMGILSSLIVGACVSPVLISALGVAIKSQDPVLGGAIMFSMSLGMGVILIAIGVGAGWLLPKAGTWMDSVKYIFGVLLIGVAIYLLGILPGVPILLLWAVFLIVTGIYMGATQAIPEGASGWKTLWKGIGTVALIWGVLALLGGMAGRRDIMQPIDINELGGTIMQQGAPAEDAHAIFTQVTSLADLDKELASAKAAGKPVMIDFFATWCTDCVRMEKSTFNNPQVQKIMSKFVALQVDVTDPGNDATEAVKKRLSVFGPPALLFYNAQGQKLKALDFYGYKNAADFSVHIKKAL